MPAPADAAKVARAEELLCGGAAPADAAAETGLSARTCYRIAARLAAAAPAPEAPAALPSPPPPTVETEVPPAETPLPAMPVGLSGIEADRWVYDQRIRMVLARLDAMHARAAEGGSTHGIGQMEKLLADLLARRAELRPPAPPNPAAEERAHRADADRVVAQIEGGVLAAEEQTRSTLRAALASWPGAADAAIRALYGGPS